MISLPSGTVISQGLEGAFFLAVCGTAEEPVASDFRATAHSFSAFPRLARLRSAAASRPLRAVAFHFFIGSELRHARENLYLRG